MSRLSEKVPLSGRGTTTKEGLTTVSSRIQQALTKPVQQVTTAVTMAMAPSSQRARQPMTVESGTCIHVYCKHSRKKTFTDQ